MKKIIVFMLALCMILVSCAEENKEPSVNSESPPDITNTEIINEPVRQVIPPNEFKIMGDLPEIGEFSGKTGGNRFYDKITYDFIPSDEYGKIIPYVDSYRYFETSDENDWSAVMGYASYGFCTEDGKIVMDASDKNSYVNYYKTDDGFGYYVLSRDVGAKEDAPDEFTPSETLLIPEDGTWVITMKENSWLSSVGGGYVSVVQYPESSDGTVKVVLYDYDGNYIRSIEEADSVGIKANGLLMVSSWKDSEYRAYFINDEGEKVLGPYQGAVSFNEFGITYVKDDSGEYLINTDGERISEIYEYFFTETCNDGKRCLYTARPYESEEKDYLDVYSEKGEFLNRIEGISYATFNAPDNGDFIYHYSKYDFNEKGYPIHDTEKLEYRRLSDGTELVSKEFGVSPNSYNCSDNCYIYHDKQEGIAYLFDAYGETIAKIDNDVHDILCVTDHGEFIVYTTGDYEYKYDSELGDVSVDTRKTFIYDTQKGENVASFDAGLSAYVHYDDKRYIILTRFISMNEVYAEEVRTSLFDTQTGELVFEDCEHLSLYNLGDKSYICTFRENCGILYDSDLNIVRKSYYE